MGKYLDFETHEKGYKPFTINKETVKANKGRKVCWVNKRYIDPYRGYYSVEHGVLDSAHYSTLILDNGNNNVDMRDIVEAGIECDG